MAPLPDMILLYRSGHEYQRTLRSVLTSWSIEVTEFKYIAELHESNILGKAPIAMAIVDEQDASGIEALRSVMHANNWIQRIMVSDSQDIELFERAINKAHINYFIGLPHEPLKLSLYLKKAWQRYQNVTRPLMKFNVLTDIAESLLHENQRYKMEANTDALTHLLNRRSFNNMLKRFWNRFKNKGMYFSLAMLDIDHFKKVNDQYGHLAGDRVLQFLADILLKNQRLGIDFTFRYGGEEFVILSASTDTSEMEQYIKRLLNLIREKSVFYQEQEIRFTFSAGISCSALASSEEELIDQADLALYSAKETGRNRVVVFRKS